ncbi:MAG TPA: NADH-quinone oxidoreductase subunit C [Symbiobacteriaceae bacterium]|jgi:NADH-quinone oxidoreductase subunit C
MANQSELIAQAREKVNADVLPALLGAFAGKVEQIPPSRDEIPQVFCKPEAIAGVAHFLDEQGFNMLVDVAGADYYPKRDPRFEVIYHFRQLPGLGMIRVRVRCTEKDQVPTLSVRWPGANAAEREVYDQFGIKFKGHPNLTRILNPDDWEGHPLRRDYPLRGPRALINLEMPADENRYHAFVDEEQPAPGQTKEGK